MTTSLDIQIEAILLFRGEPTSLKKLAEYTQSDLTSVIEAVKILKERLNEGGIILIQNQSEISLGTNPKVSGLIEKITKEELTRDLGKAGLETLAIIFYKESTSKKEIDYIRGVNSGFILRNLLIRGLVDREEQVVGRGFIYRPTIELLAYMGISNIQEMPEFTLMRKELDSFLAIPESTGDDEKKVE